MSTSLTRRVARTVVVAIAAATLSAAAAAPAEAKPRCRMTWRSWKTGTYCQRTRPERPACWPGCYTWDV